MARRKIKVEIEILPHLRELPPPSYMSPGASGVDLYAAIKEDVVLFPGERKLIFTGIKIALPLGYEAQIRPRSGLSLSDGITVLNTPGTIDADYRGEIKVIIINLGEKKYTIKRGDRIAQMIIAPVVRVQFEITKQIKSTLRNTRGFGSTGK